MKFNEDLGVALHTALRKGCDSSTSSAAWNLLYELKAGAPEAQQLLIESTSQMLRAARILDLIGHHDHYIRIGMDALCERTMAWLKEHGGVDAKEFLDDVEDRSMLHCTDCGKAMSDEQVRMLKNTYGEKWKQVCYECRTDGAR